MWGNSDESRFLAEPSDPPAVLLSGGCLDENVIRVDHNLDFHAGGKVPVVRGANRYLNMKGLT